MTDSTNKLIRGHGQRPGVEGCVMDFAVARLTNGAVWADQHPCFNRPVTLAAQAVNDRLTPEGLARLDRDFSARIDRCLAAADPEIEDRVIRRLALWAARSVEHLSDDPRVKACNDVTERWLTGSATDGELQEARATAAAATAAAATAYAAANAAAAVADRDGALLLWLSDLLDGWEKIAAEEGALGDLLTFERYQQAGGS